jgi:hypothetical protein
MSEPTSTPEKPTENIVQAALRDFHERCLAPLFRIYGYNHKDLVYRSNPLKGML